jgi:hypothetical protein
MTANNIYKSQLKITSPLTPLLVKERGNNNISSVSVLLNYSTQKTTPQFNEKLKMKN